LEILMRKDLIPWLIMGIVVIFIAVLLASSV
jgi:hypothetical protein